MNLSNADNPVARHAARILPRGGRWWVIVLLLVGAGVLGALLQRYWLELDEYSLLRPHVLVRWQALVLLSEALIALPWAAVRGALLWRRLEADGHVDDYRRSRLSSATIVSGALTAVMRPVVILLVTSLALCLALVPVGARFGGGVTMSGALLAHGLLVVQAFAFGSLGLALGGWLRYPGAAIPHALGFLAAAVAAIWAINPLYRWLPDPSGIIYACLLPNPVTAIGAVLETDVLRFGWVYQHVRAHEYFYIYPPAWQTAAFYLGLALLAQGLCVFRVRRMETR